MASSTARLAVSLIALIALLATCCACAQGAPDAAAPIVDPTIDDEACLRVASDDELHVEGAINLGFPDIAALSLAEALPDRNAVILIDCNNNFSGAEGPFPSKLPSASLNLPTYVEPDENAYRNVWELGTPIDIAVKAIAFTGSAAAPTR